MFPHLFKRDLIIVFDDSVEESHHQAAFLSVYAVRDASEPPTRLDGEKLLAESTAPEVGVRTVPIHNHYLIGEIISCQSSDEKF